MPWGFCSSAWRLGIWGRWGEAREPSTSNEESLKSKSKHLLGLAEMNLMKT